MSDWQEQSLPDRIIFGMPPEVWEAARYCKQKVDTVRRRILFVKRESQELITYLNEDELQEPPSKCERLLMFRAWNIVRPMYEPPERIAQDQGIVEYYRLNFAPEGRRPDLPDPKTYQNNYCRLPKVIKERGVSYNTYQIFRREEIAYLRVDWSKTTPGVPFYNAASYWIWVPDGVGEKRYLGAT